MDDTRASEDRTRSVRTVQRAMGAILRWSGRSLYQRIAELSGEQLDRSAITLLHVVATTGPIPLTALADALDSDAVTVRRETRSLAAEGSLHRFPQKGTTMLEVTEAGRAQHQRLATAWTAAVEELVTSWTTAELGTFAATLERFIAALEPAPSPRLSEP